MRVHVFTRAQICMPFKGEAKRTSLTGVLSPSTSPRPTYEQALAIAMHKLHRLHVENTALKREVRSHVYAHGCMCVSVCEASCIIEIAARQKFHPSEKGE